METLSNILASFDVFQVFFSAFPMITDPIVNAFQQIMATLSGFFRELFVSHPGLAFGIFIFTIGYAAVYIKGEISRYIAVKIRNTKKSTAE